MKKIALIFSLIFFVAYTSNAGPWLKKKGESYTQISFSFMKANSLFHISEPDPITLHRDVRDHTLSLYSEIGISDKLNLIVYIPMKFVGTKKEISRSNLFADTLVAGSLTTLGNASLAVKFKLIEEKYVLSTQIKVEAPGLEIETQSGLRTGYDTWTIHPALLFGKSGNKTFYSAEAGYRFRTNDYSDEFYGNIEYGYQIKKLWIIGVIEARQSMFNRNKVEPNFLQTGLFVNNQEYFSPGVKLNLEINRNLSLTAGLYGAFSGNYVLHAPSVTFGIAWKKLQ